MFAAACTSDDGGTGPTTPTSQVEGEMTYDDAATTADGTPREAERPPAQQALVTVEVRGTGTLTGLEGAQCTLEGANGQFRALFDSTVQVEDGGVYAAGYGEGDARIETLGGCEIPTLTVGVITDVVVRAELEATTANCSGYCEASARATAEAQCQGSQDQVACRGSAEANAMASCHTECTTQRDVIVAEVSLAASLLGELDAETLRAAAFGDLAVDLTFDRME